MQRFISATFLYLLLSSFIISWWMAAFPKRAPPTSSDRIHCSQVLYLKTSRLLEELSSFQRDALQKALAGHFPSMVEFIEKWDRDAQLLAQKGIKGIQRLPSETYFQARILGELLKNSSAESLRQLNCKMNLNEIIDDGGHLLHIEDHFQKFLPQTYVSATFLLAIAPPGEIIALPRGLRHLLQIYSPEILERVPADIDSTQSEKLFSAKPDLAFVAPYSHPSSLEVLRNQKIQLCTLKYIDTLKEIQESLLKVGHASNHVLEAQLLSIFIEAGILSIDNRLEALDQLHASSGKLCRMLYLQHHHHYSLPTTKCLTGQLMVRALTHSARLACPIPQTQENWSIPFEQENIITAQPDALIISTSSYGSLVSMIENQQSLHDLKAYRTKRIFHLDESIQESPTQYIVLAYYDLFQALAANYL
jgi:iron complex transport system substrate-binding protein